MLVKYKKNKKAACYDANSLVSVGKPEQQPRPRGPFPSCGNCPYPSHGFICYFTEGNCLKTDMEKIHQKREGEKPMLEMTLRKYDASSYRTAYGYIDYQGCTSIIEELLRHNDSQDMKMGGMQL